jgi:hypothetical protein
MRTSSAFIETLECDGAAGHDPSDSIASDNSKLPRFAAANSAPFRIFSSAPPKTYKMQSTLMTLLTVD